MKEKLNKMESRMRSSMIYLIEFAKGRIVGKKSEAIIKKIMAENLSELEYNLKQVPRTTSENTWCTLYTTLKRISETIRKKR